MAARSTDTATVPCVSPVELTATDALVATRTADTRITIAIRQFVLFITVLSADFGRR